MLGSDMSKTYKPGQPYNGYGSQQAFQAAGSPKSQRPQQAPAGGQKPAFGTVAGGQSTITKPKYLDINTTEDAVNNVMAQGYQYGDQRYQMKQLDRAGLSRGRGQQFIAGQEGAQAVSKAADAAAQMRSEDQMTNAKMKSDYEKARELEAQNLAMVSHAMNQADWSRRFAGQSAAAQLQMAMQQAQMNLMLALMRG